MICPWVASRVVGGFWPEMEFGRCGHPPLAQRVTPARYRGTSHTRNSPPLGPYSIYLGPYGGPRGGRRFLMSVPLYSRRGRRSDPSLRCRKRATWGWRSSGWSKRTRRSPTSWLLCAWGAPLLSRSPAPHHPSRYDQPCEVARIVPWKMFVSTDTSLRAVLSLGRGTHVETGMPQF